jgi:hypothetical protein
MKTPTPGILGAIIATLPSRWDGLWVYGGSRQPGGYF